MKFSTSTLLLLSLLFINNSYGMEFEQKTPLQRKIETLDQAVITYDVNQKGFSSRFYNWTFYLMAAGITTHSIYHHNNKIDGLIHGSINGLIGGYIAYWCSWPFRPFVQWGFNKNYARPVHKSQHAISNLLNEDSVNTMGAYVALQQHFQEKTTMYPNVDALLKTQGLLNIIASKQSVTVGSCSTCNTPLRCLTCRPLETAPPAYSPGSVPVGVPATSTASSPYAAYTGTANGSYPSL